ncbi:MAG TPA: tetratricopeptide repeat protein [Thermoflexia bacterium]|nr:tetratricopeptide repeat protein [Thermoflexia bacterium]
MTEREQLEQAMLSIATQRAALGDVVVDAALASMREKLAALTTAARSTAPERKQVTVLFADVSGFTAMSESLDAEEVSDVMRAFWKRIDAVLLAYGGVIDKHIGDGVMSLWGVNQVRENDPERAIYAALDMQTEVAAFRGEHDVQLALRVGLNTGPVLLGEIIPGEFTALGSTVNLAARMEHAAPVGGILISYDTYRHVRGVFNVLPQEPLMVKGKSQPVQTYVVQRARPRAFRMTTRGIEGIETQMVERDVELLILQNAFHAAMADATTHIVTVVGEAGVGKSRLLHEFDNWLKSLSFCEECEPNSFVRLKGHTAPEMQHIPYSIIRDMFALRLGIRESDSAAITLEKFRTRTAEVLEPDKADLIGHLIGFDFSASRAVSNLLGSGSFTQLAIANLTTYLRAITATPTIIFFEDIHWADNSSLNLIAHIVTAIPDARLLIVCLARPPFFKRRPHWGAASDNYTRLDLKPLSRRASRVLVSEILQKIPQLPDALRDLIVEGAAGNPFYVEELIKMLIEDGVILRGEARWRVELERLAEVRVPPTLTGILQARLDSLPADEKRVLQQASVVGWRFWDAAVTKLASNETEAAPVDALLAVAKSRELIFQREYSAFAGTNEYIFKHAILRDVIYETVLLKRRRVYHTQVAQWLEAHAGKRIGEYLSLIAGHYELAGEKRRAVEYLRRSGEKSRQTSAYHDAISAFERALTLLPKDDLSDRVPLLIGLGYAYRQVSDSPLAVQRFEEGLALARAPSISNPQMEVAALNGLGWTAMGQGAYTEARQLLEQSLVLAREINDRQGAAIALYNLGDVAYRQGDGATAERCAEKSLTICRELADQQGMAFAFRVLGFAAHLRGEYAETTHYHRESQQIYREIGDRWGVATCFINLGEAARKQHLYEEAAQYYEESLPLFQEIDNRIGVAIALLNLGHVHAGLDQNDISWQYLCRALQESSPIGAAQITLETLVGVSLLQIKAGRYEPAAELLGLVKRHPAFNAEIGGFIAPLLTTLRGALSASKLAAALARGETLELAAVVAEILGQAADS